MSAPGGVQFFRRKDIDATVTRMKADAAVAEQKLQKLAGARTEPRPVLDAALAEARAAFDRASQAAWSASK